MAKPDPYESQSLTMDDATEVWLPVLGYEERYLVSNLGRVHSRQKILTPIRQHRGHLMVNLYNPQRRHLRKKFDGVFIHRLVLEAFVCPRPEGLVCRHLDGDPTNNHVENLQWGTMSENGHDMVKHGRCWQSQKTECPSGHPYTPENTRELNGRRYCRTCGRERAAAWRKARHAAS